MQFSKRLYFLVFLLIVGCEKADFNLRIQEDGVLQFHNRQFFDENQHLYGKVQKSKITAKAQGVTPLNDASYLELNAVANELYTYLFNTKLVAVGESEKVFPVNGELLNPISVHNLNKMHHTVDWDKIAFQSKINSFFDGIASVLENDSLHQKLKHAVEINYERSFTEADFQKEQYDLKKAILTTASELPDNILGIQLLEFINLTTSTILLAERRTLRFLNEHYLNSNSLNFSENIETIILPDKNVYSPGETIKIDVFPSIISSPNLFVKKYVIVGPGVADSFLINGSLAYQLDTIWLPTEKAGKYKITGSFKNFIRPSQKHDFEYNYRVITE